ncbi:MAG: hypothetical protein Q7T49_01460 [bacterium]|nr:hypothetical protein [bacterium]
MLSLLPDLLSYNFYGIALLRAATGLILLVHTWEHFRHSSTTSSRFLALLEAGIAALLIIGLFTQAAALLLTLLMLGSLVINYRHKDKQIEKSYFFLLAIIGLSLATMGPGAYAIDWPL